MLKNFCLLYVWSYYMPKKVPSTFSEIQTMTSIILPVKTADDIFFSYRD